MIKFIATDLDGTLLPDSKELPGEIFGLIEQLHRRGILFAPASGRQYANLKKLFAPVADRVVFICENGALVKYRGQTLLLNPVADGDARDALQVIRSVRGLSPLLCGETNAYIENAEPPFYDEAAAAYTNCILLGSLDRAVGREPVCKIAVYGENLSEKSVRILQEHLPRLRTMLSGASWCDVSAPSVNKGAAVRVIQERFGLKREECMAFGDHMNDYEMLAACGTAYVPENAYPPLKARIGQVIPANGEGGVLVKLRELLAREL